MKRALHLRLASALLALALAAPSFAAVEAAASCCCLHAQRKCHCPVCEHARELESGQRHFKHCGESHEAVRTAALPDALPPSSGAQPLLTPLAAPLQEPLALHPAPPLEVLTPPPLA